MVKIKRISTILFIFILGVFFMNIEKVFAAVNIIELTNISIIEESSSANGQISNYSSNDVDTNNTYHAINNYIEYELTIKNVDSKTYSIKSISNDNKNPNIYYEYSKYKNKILKPNKEVKIRIRENYSKEVSDLSKRVVNDRVKFYFNLVDENGVEIYTDGDNPFTGDNLVLYVTIGALSLTFLLIAMLLIYLRLKKKQLMLKLEEERRLKELETPKKKRKRNTVKKLLILLVLSLAILPFNTKAASEVEATITFNNNTALYSKVNVTFKYNGIEKTKTVKYDSLITEPRQPKKKGYKFIGWYNGNTKFDFTSKLTTDIELNARYEKSTYTITYNLDGGTGSNPSTYDVSDLPITLENPTKRGYTFIGWTWEGQDTPQKDLEIDNVNKNLEYTANYTIKEYNITYKGITNAEKNNLNNPNTYTVNDTVTLNNPAQRNDKNGEPSQKFLGWKDDNNDVSINVTFSNSTKDKKFEAVWFDLDPSVYTITYELNGGSVDGENPNTFTKTTEDFTLINPTKRGFNFIGWTGTGLSEPTMVVTVEQGTKTNLSFTANFEKINYNLSYELNGGSVSSANPATYTVTDAITLNAPTKRGYTFTGWTGTGLNEPTINVTIPANSVGNRSYEAHYSIKTYTITYNLYDGVVSSNPDSYKVTDTFTLNNPSKEGYSFAGWTWDGHDTPELSVTISDSVGNLEFTANYNAANYYIHFDKNDSDATGTMNDLEMSVGTAKALTLNAFSKAGYGFDKWTTNPDGTGTVYDDGETVNNLALTGTVTLYARWKKLTTATFITGSELNSKMSTLAGSLNSILKVKYVSNLTEENKTSGTVVSVSTQSDEPIYMWWDSSTRTIYYGSDAEVIYLNKTCSMMFNNMKNVSEIDTNFDTSKCTTMAQMFYMNNNLSTITLSNFDTSNVESMVSMFGHNYTAHNYDINGWDVSKVKNFQTMFIESSGITTLDLSNWHTDSATNMIKMFANVNQATSIKVDNFNTSKVTNMEKMFDDTKKLKTLDLSSFDTRKATSMVQFFQNTLELESLTLGPLFTIERTTSVSKMFENTGLTTVDISMFNTANVNTFNNMFDGANLTTIYVGSGFVTTGQTSNPVMFNNATNLVGGAGTTYSDNTKLYARIDNPSGGEPGYFTLAQ